MRQNSSAAFADSKPHYELLDGLRGVAALLVIWYHIFEGFSFAGNGAAIKVINHGYLAVDFFFMLSGFVIAYAYDERFAQKRLSLGGFFKRRIIRLHPMAILGAFVGLTTYLIQGSVQWDGTHVGTPAVVVALLCAMLFVPATPGAFYNVRGGLGEMFPLNGTAWSLFFEYIGNILYALFIHRLSNKTLAWFAGIWGAALVWYTTTDVSTYGMFGVGWTLDGTNLLGGFIRIMFPFTMGMLIQRHFKPVKVKGAFWIGAGLLAALFHVPYIESSGALCLNGVFEAFCIICVFPVIIRLAASGVTTDKFSTGVCKFLGDISYPLYITHFPFMYLFYAWLMDQQLYTLAETWPVAIGVCVWCVFFAYLSLKLYDEPVRKWLTKRFQ